MSMLETIHGSMGGSCAIWALSALANVSWVRRASLLEDTLDLFRAHCNSAGAGSSLLTLGDLALQEGEQKLGHRRLEEAEALLAQGGHAAALLRLGHMPSPG